MILKLLFAGVIFAAAWFGAKLPSLIQRRSGTSQWLGWCTAFAAGIFLGFGLIHLLGEARETWTAMGASGALAPVLAGIGFMAILLLEHVLLPPAAHGAVHSHSGEPLPAAAAVPLGSRTVPWTLLLGLTIHSFLAGIALGAEASLAGAAFIFAAIVAHKWAAAFALGTSLVKHEIGPRRSRRLLLLFSSSTPVGILLGAAAAGLLLSAPGRAFEGVFGSLTAGAFIYIGATDILGDESHHAGERLAKWLIAAAAVGLTALLSLWV